MQATCEVVYYHHSGFTVSVNDTLAVFDYWEGAPEPLKEEKRLTSASIAKYKHVFIFTSHAHPDHMDPVIYTLEHEPPIVYITSFDTPVGIRGRRMAPLDDMPLIDGVRVKAFGSTDTGVSYLVDMYGVKIFHAGDLNLWHWREESSLREIEAAEKAFEEAVAPITKEKVDIAMFPVDPRQGIMFDAGANYFILGVKPKVFIPMHFHKRTEVAVEYARRAGNKQTSVFALTKPHEKLVVTFSEDTMAIEVFNQKEPALRRETAIDPDIPQAEPAAFSEGDPFAESDLPVDIQTDDAEGGL